MTKKSWHQRFVRKTAAQRKDEDGQLFASKGELLRWQGLQFLERAGIIRDLRRQVSYPLQLEDGRAVLTPTGRVAKYRPDFVYIECASNQEIIEDYKGFYDKNSQFKIAVFEMISGKKVSIKKR